MNMKISIPELSLRTKFVLVAFGGFLSIGSVVGLGVFAGNKTREYIDNYYWAEHKVMDVNHGYKNVELTFSLPITREPLLTLTVLSPVASTKVNVIETSNGKVVVKELTLAEKKAVIKNAKYPFIINGFWMKETTQGKGRNDNDPTNHQSNCAKRGLSNEFGYDPQHNTCFESFEESVAFLDNYIDEHLKELSVNQMLCLYSSTGKAVDSCEYSISFRTLERQGLLALK